MDIFTIVVGSALAALFAFFIARFVFTIGSNLVKGRRFHDDLEKSFDGLRLSSMIQRLGINKYRYIRVNQVIDIERHMENCSNCENTESCDDKLAAAANGNVSLNIDNIDFCNNEAEMKEIYRREQA